MIGRITRRERIAWAAGFFDGEGYVGCMLRAGKHSPNALPTLDLSIGQSDSYALEKFRDIVSRGKVYGPYPPRGTERKQKWVYRLRHTVDVMHAFHLLRPWLGPVKRDQFEAAFAKYNKELECLLERTSKHRG